MGQGRVSPDAVWPGLAWRGLAGNNLNRKKVNLCESGTARIRFGT